MLSVTYEYYHSIFCGGRSVFLSREEFDKNIGRAERLTLGMLTSEPNEAQSEKVRFAICEAAEAFGRLGNNDSVASESIDGYSVSYREGKSAEESAREAIRRTLSGSGLLYAGVEQC